MENGTLALAAMMPRKLQKNFMLVVKESIIAELTAAIYSNGKYKENSTSSSTCTVKRPTNYHSKKQSKL